MAADYIPGGKHEMQAWINNFVSAVAANATALGVSPAELAALTGLQTSFSAALGGVTTAKASLKSAVEAETSASHTLTNDVRALTRRFQANPNITPPLKAALGVNPRTTVKNHAPPVTPTGLTVEGFSSGVNTVKWNRADNKPNTIFRVEAQIGAANDWTEVGSTGMLTFHHTGQTPGVQAAYRVIAYRAKQASVPSAAVVVYSGGANAPALTLRKAA